jgi:hypothetical protein
MPCTSAGAQRSTSISVKAALPQPTSTQRHPGAGASQRKKASPTDWLQMPM